MYRENNKILKNTKGRKKTGERGYLIGKYRFDIKYEINNKKTKKNEK